MDASRGTPKGQEVGGAADGEVVAGRGGGGGAALRVWVPRGAGSRRSSSISGDLEKGGVGVAHRQAVTAVSRRRRRGGAVAPPAGRGRMGGG
jgi:hypothetical protein